MPIPTTKFKNINLDTEMMDAKTITDNFIQLGEKKLSFGQGNTINTDSGISLGVSNKHGIKAWYWTGVDKENNYIYLTNNEADKGNGSTTLIENFNSGYAKNDIVTIINNNNYDDGYTVLNVNGNRIQLNYIPFNSVEPALSSAQLSSKYTIKNLSKPNVGCVYIGESSVSIGAENTVNGNGSCSIGYKNTAYGAYSMSQGRECVSQGYTSHAEGYNTKAIGHSSHAEGRDNVAGHWDSHVEGNNNQCLGMHSHAEGLNTYISKDSHSCHASGCNVRIEGTRTFAWNQSDDTYIVPQSRNRTFNINPKNGIKGIYIGHKNLVDCVSEELSITKPNVQEGTITKTLELVKYPENKYHKHTGFLKVFVNPNEIYDIKTSLKG